GERHKQVQTKKDRSGWLVFHLVHRREGVGSLSINLGVWTAPHPEIRSSKSDIRKKSERAFLAE
ncbi:MAG: hypothetical protein NTW03_10605, partial [Verrucomicrobia bacterium]|nr:hypothetical protein [Verrucomicrobiota bacterium]